MTKNYSTMNQRGEKIKRIWMFPASRYYPGSSFGNLEGSHDNVHIGVPHSSVLQIPSV
jgi:hypothetical protein